MPSCSRCRKDSRRVYVVSAESDRCSNYVLAGSSAKYDVWGPSQDTLDKAEEKEKEEKETEARRKAESQQLAATTGSLSNDFLFDFGFLPGPDNPVWETLGFSRTPQISGSS
ncbi:uncharacterized protein BP5553_08414 [Venustampulla echinocandica]|uniref:Uncharacterized protein n=1 Tax=Venustampulla echinocandica TaxID=2656787 RepID=A0A370TE57_9HELO|nr:uncharacterized protein BP5553_08414 [Venustampulla echinocandica]RDL32975.1 hypothetical protein BP5553_08414 [Venustampulla echinocandica]